jgi:hypothetical protein
MNKTIADTQQFRSKSNPGVLHTLLKYSDGTASCNCMGWTRHVNKDGTRHCKHMDLAGVSKSATEGCARAVTQPFGPKTVIHASPKHTAAALPKRPIRRFHFEDD